jgi:hypothetical protein
MSASGGDFRRSGWGLLWTRYGRRYRGRRVRLRRRAPARLRLRAPDVGCGDCLQIIATLARCAWLGQIDLRSKDRNGIDLGAQLIAHTRRSLDLLQFLLRASD